MVLESLRREERMTFEQERGEVGLVKEELLKVRKQLGKMVGKKGESHGEDNRENDSSVERIGGEPLSLKYLNGEGSDTERI